MNNSLVKDGHKNVNDRLIYMDYQATTPCDPRVVEAMLPYLTTYFGNMHSRNHKHGHMAEEAVEAARKQVADVIGAVPKDIVFTSGATESNNLAIKGCARYCRASGKNKIVTLNTEHKCVIESCIALEKEGFEVVYVPVKKDGLVDLELLANAIDEHTSLVSVAAVHNEIGVIQPLEQIGQLCEEKGVYFHTDAAQAIGKIPIDVSKCKIDLMSISGHKFYAPKGIGALYVGTKSFGKKRRVRLSTVVHGGGQERGIRSGTVPVHGCVGLGKAIELAEELRESECSQYKLWFDEFLDYITSRLDYVYLNGSREMRVSHNVNLSFRFVEGESLMLKLPWVCLSSGSACTSASLEPSYVLHALGVDDEIAHTSIRFGFGRGLTRKDVMDVAEALVEAVKELREASPLAEMVREGIDLNSIEWTAH